MCACAAITQARKRCRRCAIQGSSYCKQHTAMYHHHDTNSKKANITRKREGLAMKARISSIPVSFRTSTYSTASTPGGLYSITSRKQQHQHGEFDGDWTDTATTFEPRDPRGVKVLGGIVSFAFYPKVLGRKILVTGYPYGVRNTSGCHMIPRTYKYDMWLRDLAEAAPECIDVLFEHLPSETWQGGDSVRFHSLEVRTMFNPRKILSEIRRPENQFLHPESNFDVSFLRKMLEYITGLDTSPHTAGLYKVAMTRWYSSVGKTYDVERDGAAIRSAHAAWNKASSSLDGMVNAKNLKHAIVDAEILAEMSDDNAEKSYSPLARVELDLYALICMFTVFDETQMRQTPTKCKGRDFKKLKNIIVYAGEPHSRIVRSVIERTFGVKPSVSAFMTDKGGIRQKSCVILPENFDFFSK